MIAYRYFFIFVSVLACSSCTTAPATHIPERDLGLLWVKHAAEYRAVSLQVYQSATRALPVFIDDRSWTVMPGNEDLRDLPPAVILDIDETVVSNADFQLVFERPITQLKLDTWNRRHIAIPVLGVVEFVTAAQQMGVAVYFVTNRPCRKARTNMGSCPEKDTIIDDLREIGIRTDHSHVYLADERGWNREKLTRRQHIAKTHRIIMLIGDDLSDFIPCVRSKVHAPCTEVGTRESRRQKVQEYLRYWGKGWYILPNPMHGSWASVR